MGCTTTAMFSLTKLAFAAALAASAEAFRNPFDEGDDDEAVSISVNAGGFGADRVAVEIYDVQPTQDNISDRKLNLGEWRPNARNKVTFFGHYNDDITLLGSDSLAGKYVGLRCTESGNLVCSGQINVQEIDG